MSYFRKIAGATAIRSVIAPVIIFSCAGSAFASATYLTFTPRKVAGTVVYWTSTSGSWLPVREGVPIPEKTLVQVGSKSRIVLEIESQSEIRGRGASVIETTISVPMVFRVERDLVRKMKINRKAFATAAVQQEFQVAAMAVLGDLAQGHLREAFRSLLSMARGGDGSDDADPVEKDLARAPDGGDGDGASGAFAQTSGGRIKVLHPLANAQIHLDDIPGYFRIFWEIPGNEKDAEAQVFFWPEGESRGPPVVVTKDNHYNLLVTRPGAYNIQVATVKWTAKSSVKKAFFRKAQDAPEIVLKTPPGDFVFATASKSSNIPFSWEFRNFPAVQGDDEAKTNLEIVIAPDDKGPPREKVYPVTTGGSAVLPIRKRGTFLWYVRAGTVESARSRFTIANLEDERGVIARTRSRHSFVYFDKAP